MNRPRLPPDAFAFYLGLGATRSYALVAEKYGVSKQCVVRTAARERWQARLVEAENKVAVRSEERVLESLDQMAERHIKTLQVIAKRALESLRTMPISTAMDAVRALDISIKGERVARGEPSDRSAVDVERVIREQYAKLLVVDTGEKEVEA